MWVALRAFSYRTKTYQKGDTVPAEGWPNRRALSATRRIQFIPDVVPEPPPIVPSRLRRAELNEYASSLGIENPEGFQNRESLLERVNETLNPSEAPNDDVPPVVVEEDKKEDEETDEDVDPFADLNDPSDDDGESDGGLENGNDS